MIFVPYSQTTKMYSLEELIQNEQIGNVPLCTELISCMSSMSQIGTHMFVDKNQQIEFKSFKYFQRIMLTLVLTLRKLMCLLAGGTFWVISWCRRLFWSIKDLGGVFSRSFAKWSQWGGLWRLQACLEHEQHCPKTEVYHSTPLDCMTSYVKSKRTTQKLDSVRPIVYPKV